MKPGEGLQALNDLGYVISEATKLRDGLVLITALARDAEPVMHVPFVRPIADPVHKATVKAVDKLRVAASAVNQASVALHWVIAEVEPDGRAQRAAVPTCDACGKPATPRPRDGFCGPCYSALQRFNKTHTPDRAAYISHRQARRNAA
jgi:hypothetical protein